MRPGKDGIGGGGAPPDQGIHVVAEKLSPVKPSTAGRTRTSPGKSVSAGCWKRNPSNRSARTMGE